MPEPTKREIEIKLRVNDVESILRRIRGLGATSRGRVLEQNTIYDTPEYDFRRAGRLIRLRVETPMPRTAPGHTLPLLRPHARSRRTVLTSKSPPHPDDRGFAKLRYKERLERELVIRAPKHWPRILRLLGFRPSFRYEKFRSTFELAGLHVDLDETPAGTFLELEGAPDAIERAARALGFAPSNYFLGTYWDVYAADCRRRGRPLKNMVFGG